MKNVLKAFSVIALVAVIGFSMAACDDGGGDGDGESWYTYNDSIDGGTSTIDMTRGSGNDSNKLTFSGNVWKIPGQTWGYAGWGTAPNGASLTAFRNADSFSFKCKGDGKKYWMLVTTSDITDHDDYYTVFTVPKAEQTITINYSALAQAGWGVPKTFNKNNIIGINFHARAESNITGEGPFTVTMWDLKANGGSSSGGGSGNLVETKWIGQDGKETLEFTSADRVRITIFDEDGYESTSYSISGDILTIALTELRISGNQLIVTKGGWRNVRPGYIFTKSN